jgi:hypothetical protein
MSSAGRLAGELMSVIDTLMGGAASSLLLQTWARASPSDVSIPIGNRVAAPPNRVIRTFVEANLK